MRISGANLALSLAVLVGLAARPAVSAPLQALSVQDTQYYAAAFDAAEKGDFTAADQTLAKVSDPCLAGRVQYLELTHPKARNATFEELKAWLKTFGDLPGANVVYQLALKLRPAGETPPTPSGPAIAESADGDMPARSGPAPQSKPAREAYSSGDLRRALALAQEAGDPWIAGLAAYRLGDFSRAMTSFQIIASNPGEDDWRRSAGAFWAARAAVAAGIPDAATPLLKIAAAAPDTFYGMIAARKLQLADDPLGRLIETATSAHPAPLLMQTSYEAAPSDPDGALRELVATDPRARRAVALTQLGRRIDAGSELRAGVAAAPDEPTRALWVRLMYRLSSDAPQSEIVLHDEAPPQSSAFYPAPDLAPAGGFTVDRALVYAVIWQESRFNSLAVSPVGAVGLMQLMRPSAAGIAGDPSLNTDPMPLFDPGRNLQLGQAYLGQLINQMNGADLLRAIAAYNAGPGTVARTEAVVGPDADSLMVIESLPYAETRAYVQKVTAAYWSYRRQFGVDSRTLDAAASDRQFIDARLDASAGRQDTQPASPAPARQALEIMLHHPG